MDASACCAVTLLLYVYFFFFRFVLCVYIFNPRDEGRGGEGFGGERGERGDGKKKGLDVVSSKTVILLFHQIHERQSAPRHSDYFFAWLLQRSKDLCNIECQQTWSLLSEVGHVHDRKCWIRNGREVVEPKSNGWDPRFRGLIRGEGKKRCIFFFSFRYSASIFISLCRIKVPSRFRLCDIDFIGHYVASGPRTMFLGLPK